MVDKSKVIKKRFAKSVSEVLAGIKIPSLKAEQEKKLKQMSDELYAIITETQQYKGNIINFIPDTLIELCDGRVRFSSKAGALVDEHCQIFVETDDQMQVYKLSCTLADTLNKLQPYIILYRYRDPMDTVSKVDGTWQVNDNFVISMPTMLAQFKVREAEAKREQEEERAKQKAKQELYASMPANISIEQAAAIIAEREQAKANASACQSETLSEAMFEKVS